MIARHFGATLILLLWAATLSLAEESGEVPGTPVGQLDSSFNQADSQANPASFKLFEAKSSEASGIGRPRDLSALMRPTFDISTEWQTDTDNVDLAFYDAKVRIPTYPIFGPPPPSIHLGFSYVDLNAPATLELPPDLYDYSFGLSWMRPLKERWMLRLMFSAAIATDGENTSGDAWQFRGGLFAMYRPNEQWTWIFGALALGRQDIPVVPALGAIWQPNPALRIDLTLPKPRVSYLVAEQDSRQQWVYLGSGFSGGTWAYQDVASVNDQITYRDWRFTLGWESTPRREPGMPFARGRVLGAEIGYVFSREFEFRSGMPSIRLDDTIMLRAFGRF